MWIVFKYKINQLNILKKSLRDLLGNDLEYFIPRIKYDLIIKTKIKTFQKSILEGYLICFDEKFNDKNIVNRLKYTKGINYILDGFQTSQNEILDFVNKCKKFQDQEGFMKQDFFSKTNFTKARFISGPFTNLVFEVLSQQADKIEILIGKYKTILSKNSRFLYKPI